MSWWAWLTLGIVVGTVTWPFGALAVMRLLSWIEVQNRPLYPPPDMEDPERLR